MSLVKAIENDRVQTESLRGDVVLIGSLFVCRFQMELFWKVQPQRVIVPYVYESSDKVMS